eukprot:4942453-Amphidinium_carterae.1
MAVAAPLSDALTAAFVEVGLGQPLSEAFLEAFGGIEATIESTRTLPSLALRTLRGPWCTQKEPTQAEGGDDAGQEEGQELKPLTKARIRRAVHLCKAMWQPLPLAVADSTVTPAGETLVKGAKGKERAPESSLQPMTSTLAASQLSMGRKRSKAEVERLSAEDVNKLLDTYRRTRGAAPHPMLEPTTDQIGADSS